MKKKSYFFKVLLMALAAVMSVGLTACGSDDSSSDSNNVSVSQNSVSFTEAGGSQVVSITSNTNWTISGAPSWLTVSPQSGSGSGSISLMAQANTDAPRQATLMINAGSASTMISVSQMGKSTSSGVTITNSSTYTLERFTVVMCNAKYETFSQQDFGTFYPGNTITMPIPTGATQYYMGTYLNGKWFVSPDYDIQFTNLTLSTSEIGQWKANSSAPQLFRPVVGE